MIELNFGYELLTWFNVYYSDRAGAICYLLLLLQLLLSCDLTAGYWPSVYSSTYAALACSFLGRSTGHIV